MALGDGSGTTFGGPKPAGDVSMQYERERRAMGGFSCVVVCEGGD
jgi:hypothetical protein